MPEIFKSNKGATKSKDGSDEIEKILEACPTSQWGSFMAQPNWSKFESQQEEEKVVIMGRRHLVTNLGWMTILSFAIFIPLFWNEFPFIQTLNGTTLASLTVLWYMALAFYGLQSFLMWFYNIYIVTNERIIEVHFMGLLNKTVDVTQLSKIEDANYSQKGLIGSFFNFGDVEVETASKQDIPDLAGGDAAFTFESIAYPDKVVEVISKLIDNEENENYHTND